MKPYDWSVVEPDITETVDAPHWPRFTVLLLGCLVVVMVVWVVTR